MRVLLIEPLALTTGHQSWYIWSLGGALQRAGVQASVLTYSGMHPPPRCSPPAWEGATVIKACQLTPSWFRRLVAKFCGAPEGAPVCPGSRLSYRIYVTVATVVCVRAAVRSVVTGYEVAHFLNPPDPIAIALVRNSLADKVAVVWTVFAPPEEYTAKALLPALKVHWVVQTENLQVRWANIVGKERVSHIPLGVGDAAGIPRREECRRRLGLPEDGKIVAVFGCLGPRKGYQFLYAAIRDLPRDFWVLLAGHTPDWVRPRPAEVAATYGWLERTILRTDFISETEFPLHVRAADVVCLLYEQADASSGILSWCEALGVPVLATRFGEIGKTVRERGLGLTVDPRDAASVQNALIDLFRGRSRHSAAKYRGPSWEEVAALHKCLYDRLNAARMARPLDIV